MDSIERIRSATFNMTRRGYERREVDTFLAQIADWLEGGGGDEARSATVKRELERVAEKTGKILTAAEEVGEQMRVEGSREARSLVDAARTQADAARDAAESYASETRAEADGYSETTRADADGYSSQVRSEADGFSRTTRSGAETYAAETTEKANREAASIVAAAEEKARRTVEEGVERRRDVESVIADLVERRDAIFAQLERMSAELSGTAKHHRKDGDRFAIPEQLDPGERPAEETKASTQPSKASRPAATK